MDLSATYVVSNVLKSTNWFFTAASAAAAQSQIWMELSTHPSGPKVHVDPSFLQCSFLKLEK